MKLNLMNSRTWIVLLVLAICLVLFNWAYRSVDNSEEEDKHIAGGGGCTAKHE